MTRVKSMKWYAVFSGVGLVVGVGAGLVTESFTNIGNDLVSSIYYAANPVITAQYSVTDKKPDAWALLLESHKHQDCQLIEVQAFDVSADMTLRRLRFERADGKPPSGMAPGKFRSAAYTVEPPEHTLRLYFVHSCGPGRVVRTEVTPA